MKNKMIVLVVSIAALVALPARAQKESLAVSNIKPTPALAQSTDRAGRKLEMERLIQSLDGQLIDRLNATRKFEIVARSDIKDLIGEQEFSASGNVNAGDKAAAQQFKIAGAKYLLITSLDDFQDVTERAEFVSTGKAATKRVLRASAVGKIYDATTGRLLESANFQTSVKQVEEVRDFSKKTGELNEELIVTLSRQVAEKIACRVMDVIFPAKVLAKTDKQITINRGDGSGIAVGQVWNVFVVGKELIDPDTKESLGREEVQMGAARVTAVLPKTSRAELTEDRGVEVGAVVRPVPQDKADGQ